MKHANVYLLLAIALPFLAHTQPSRIELHTMQSVSLGAQMSFNVFLPKDYDSSTDHYPVVYLFRGDVNEWANPYQDASRRGNIKTVADTLYESGAIGKMIFIMPGLSAPATYADLSSVVSELIPYVDLYFRTIPSRTQRGMDGFSYGGLSTLRLTLTFPEYFSSVGAYDASVWAIDPYSYNLTDSSLLAQIKPMQFLIHGGGDPTQSNLLDNIQFMDTLAQYGIYNTFPEIRLTPDAVHNWYYADLHMSYSLPLHWQKFMKSRANVKVQLASSVFSGKLSGNVVLQWSVPDRIPGLKTFVEYSRNGGTSWVNLYESAGTDTTIQWLTTSVPDGTRYLLRVIVSGDTSYGIAETPSRFTIDNPGNAPPDIELLAPSTATTISGVFDVNWWANDAEGDTISITLDASTDDGVSWQSVASNLPNTGSYSWDTRPMPNSESNRFRVRASDGTTWADSVSGRFSIHNDRNIQAASTFHHVQGTGDGMVTSAIVDPTALTGHTYRVTIDDTSGSTKTYEVTDLNTGMRLVTGGSGIGTPNEGPLFDGLRIAISDFASPVFSKDSTRWIQGNSELMCHAIVPQFVSGNGIPYPADFQIRIYDHVVDTSSSLMFSTPTPIYFSVWNITEGHKVEIIFSEIDNDHKLSPSEDFVIVERNKSGDPIITWDVVFEPTTVFHAPVAGDILLMRVMKPLTSRDVFEFTTIVSGIARNGLSVKSFNLAQNYPNPFNPATTISYQLPHTTHVLLKVYNLLGQEVATLANEVKHAGSYTVNWDASKLASGVYFYKLQAGRFQETKRMILMK